MEQGSEYNGGINRIAVRGFKSLVDECSIDVRPLTILAGTNSSGKSSMMQPILLMKQTLASSFDPGALLLNGSHVRFTSVEQMLSRGVGSGNINSFSVEIGSDSLDCKVVYHAKKKPGLQIEKMVFTRNVDRSVSFHADIKNEMTEEEVEELFLNVYRLPVDKVLGVEKVEKWKVARSFCFLRIEAFGSKFEQSVVLSPLFAINEINRLIHLPGLRGNPERTYTTTAVDELHRMCRGTFETYTASVIHDWQESNNTEKLLALGQQLKLLGLAEQVKTKQINDTEVEVFVSRTLGNTVEEDWVSIADVGLGVSQTLPVAVALLFAEPGQLVYIEQPEIHLHPRAQYDLAKLLAQAAARGVKVVIETHSSLLLKGIQTLIATDQLNHDLVALHWFTRNAQGETQITSAEMDEIGAFGDWPEDFAEVELAAEMRYLDAVENKELETGEEEQQSDGD